MEDSDHRSTQSGAMIGSDDELLTKILLQLHAISILRFKSVSKHWRRLLGHRRFTLLYDTLSKSPGLFARGMYIPFNVENRSTPPFRILDFYFDPCGIKIVQSCNGLLLCCSDQGNEGDRKYYVFNPTTRQFAIIPSVPGGPDVRQTIISMSLAFHQTDCVSYKVICVRRLQPELFQIQIYSSDIGEWKISIECSFEHRPNKGVYWNGAIHWYPSDHNHSYFEVEAERLQALPLPEVALYEGYYCKELPTYFGESRGHLHLVTKSCSWDHLRLNVYELSSNHLRWFVKYQVEFDELIHAFPEVRRPTSYYFDVVDVVGGEKEEDAFMVVKISEKIITYNFHDKSLKKIFTLTPDMYGLLRGHRYTETLSSFQNTVRFFGISRY